jgi:AcrR family transcriptional regulator
MDKRDAIMQAALQLFAERGFYGTSVAQIADLAGVGAGTIYRYFKDKEMLVNEIFQYWKRELARAILDDLSTDQSFRQVFHHIWTRMSKFSKDNPHVIKFLEFHHHASYLDDESRRISDMLAEQFQNFIETQRRDQVTREAPPELLVAILIGAFVGVEKAARNGELELTPEIEAEAEEIGWQAIRR